MREKQRQDDGDERGRAGNAHYANDWNYIMSLHCSTQTQTGLM
jgi:hypothetical protein